MKVIADLCVIPLGVGNSVSKQVLECERVLSKFDIKLNLHAYGTNLEGEWDEVMAAIKACHEKLHASGVARISSSLKLGTRLDKEQSIISKINSIKDNL